MKKGVGVSVALILVLMMCDIPVVSEENPHQMYREYRDSLFDLQQEVARLHLELRQKNLHAVYQHFLHTIERTATLIGEAEPASHDVIEGMHFSVQGQLELLLTSGPLTQNNLSNLGYTEEDIADLTDSLARYNDYYHHMTVGFTPQERERFHELGLTDDDIAQLHVGITDYYTDIRTYEEVVKQSQRELLYIQIWLSLAALKILLENQDRAKGTSDLMNAEEKLLETILNSSNDQKSLQKVKSYSKQVYKAAEHQIRKEKKGYFIDFFIGLQIHCGAVTALHGDPEMGWAEVRSYTRALIECMTPERPTLSAVSEQEQPSRNISPANFAGQEEDSGNIEESNEDNNRGWITVLVKASDTTDIEFMQIVYYFIRDVLMPWVQQKLIDFVKHCITTGVEIASFTINVAGTILLLIITAPGVGGEWVHSFWYDPSGTFDEIVIDQDAKDRILRQSKNTNLRECERRGYDELYDHPDHIVDAVMCAARLYQCPNDHYFFYEEKVLGDQWVVEVEDMGYGLGRVVEAYKVLCDYTCNDIPCRIFEKWELYDNYTLVWSRSCSYTAWI